MTLRIPKPPQDADQNTPGFGRRISPLRSIVSHRLLAIAVGCGVLLVGLPFAWWKGTPKYRAEGALYVSPRFLRNLDGDQEHELQSNSQYREFVQQQVRTVNRFDILQSATAPGSMTAKLWHKGNESQRRAVERLRAAIQVAPVPDTYQVTVALEGEEPAGLAEIVNAVMQAYVSTAHRELLFDSDARLGNLKEEKSQLETAIARLIEDRTAIAKELGTTVFSGAIINSFDRQLGTISEALQEARRQRFVAEASVGSKDGPASPAYATVASALQNALSDNSLNSFKSALSQRKAELLVSINGLSPQHPARIAAEKAIQNIDRECEAVTIALRDRLAGNLETINRARFEQSKSVEQRLIGENQEVRRQTEDYSRAYQRSLELGEELDRVRKRLHAVEDRISYLQLESRAPGFVRIFSPALVPEIPVEGGRKRLALLVLAVALVIGMLAPIGLDYLDPRVRTPGELESQLGLPLTGWLPQFGEPDAAAMLRAAVSIRRHASHLTHRVLVVTALSHGGGSSTVSLGLGKMLNRLGMRTLTVEANPITPDARYLAATGCENLVSWLGSTAGAGTSFTPASGDLPDRLATGPATLEDLLPAERLIPLFERHARDFDLILIDAAPLSSNLATEELVRVFGSALVVVDAHRDKRRALTQCLQKLAILAPEVFGAVLNKVGHDVPVSPQGNKSNDTSVVLAA